MKAKADLEAHLGALDKHLDAALRLRLTRVRARALALTSHRVFEAERGRLRNAAQRVDDLARRARTGLTRQRERGRDRLRQVQARLAAFRFERQMDDGRQAVARHVERLRRQLAASLEARRASLGQNAARLASLSPLAVLGRGYALAWKGEHLLRQASDVDAGDLIRLRLHRGALHARVTAKENE